MAVWWMKIEMADREIALRSPAERRRDLLNALKQRVDRVAEPAFPLLFFVYDLGTRAEPAAVIELRRALRSTVADEDIVYMGRIGVDQATRISALVREEDFDALFDSVWI